MKKTLVCGLWAVCGALLLLGVTGCDSDDDLTGDEIYIKPASYTFRSAEDKMTTLSVHGAKPPFQWKVSDASLGSISGVTADEDTFTGAANYTRVDSKYGINTVIVTDSRGWQASSVMNVPERLDEPDTGTNGSFFLPPAGADGH
jgi:hypothetical protein